MLSTPRRLLNQQGVPFKLDPDIDAPLVGPAVLSLVGDSSACAMWRIFQPFSALRLRGYPAASAFNADPHALDNIHAYDAILLCRLSWWGKDRKKAINGFFKPFHDQGKRVWYECDDDLFSPFVVQQQHQGIAKGKTLAQLEEERTSSAWAMAQCDGVTVTTQRLAAVVRQYTDTPVVVIPNAIDVDWFTAVQQHGTREVPGLTIGWAGGNRPDGDLKLMAQAWGRIAERHPDVTFVLIGHQPWVVSEYVPEHRIKRLPWREQTEYPLSLVNVDIACCPLENRPFNRCKSGIKVMEAGLSGSAVVASPTVYDKFVTDGTNGRIAEDVDDWEEALSTYVEHEEYRRETARHLKADVLAKWSLRRNVWRWPDAWQKLYEGVE